MISQQEKPAFLLQLLRHESLLQQGRTRALGVTKKPSLIVSLEAKRKSKEFLKVEEFSRCFIYPSLDRLKWVRGIVFTTCLYQLVFCF